jgi:23S rRNA pseudouridine1911/1915/1917 synthase
MRKIVSNEQRTEIKKDIAPRILYIDANCVVVNKVAGEAVEGAGKGMVDLPGLLAAELSGSRWPGVLPAKDKDALAMPAAVHRLDVPVSGCALFARTGTALRFLNNVFRNHVAEKCYWAIIEQPKNNAAYGQLQIEEFNSESTEIIHWINFDSRKNKSSAYDEPGPGRKKAILRYRLCGIGRDYIFLKIELATGRHHQIRAQLERLGLHIKGDLKYGARRSERSGGIRLHACSLSFPDPANNGKSIIVQADPPLNDNLWQAFKLTLRK